MISTTAFTTISTSISPDDAISNLFAVITDPEDHVLGEDNTNPKYLTTKEGNYSLVKGQENTRTEDDGNYVANDDINDYDYYTYYQEILAKQKELAHEYYYYETEIDEPEIKTSTGLSA